MSRYIRWCAGIALCACLTTDAAESTIDSGNDSAVEDGATAADAAPPVDDSGGRVMTNTTEVAAGEVLRNRLQATASATQALWLQDDAATNLALLRPARRARRGTVVLLAQQSAGFDGLAAKLGSELARHGWQTLQARLPTAPDDVSDDVDARVRAALAAAEAPGLTLLLGIGAAGRWAVAALDRERSLDGAIAINVAAADAAEVVRNVDKPVLLLQEEPHGWPDDYLLGERVEVRLLPRGAHQNDDNRLARFVRGWIKRRFEGAS